MATDIKDALKNVTVTDGEQSTVKIEGEIPFEILNTYREAAVKELGKEVEIDGFRKGHVPEKVLVEHVGEMKLLTEMAERALSELYPEIIKEHEINVVGRPDISITKIAMESPLGFSATAPVMPGVTLPDYKAIAKEQNANFESPEVTTADVDETIAQIQKQKQAYERLQQNAQKKEGADDGTTTLPTPETVEQKNEAGEEKLPELTDEYVKTLGEFESVDDFKKKVREHLETQKKQEAVEKRRAGLTDAIIEKSEITVPQVMIDSELHQMFAQMEEDIKRAGLTMDGYLEHTGKTKEQLQEEWKPAAEKRAKLQLILNKIAEEEAITPDAERVESEVQKLLEQYKEADAARVRIYVETMLANEKVIEMLESQ